MSEQPSDHWLWRLSARDWLTAGQRELDLGRERVASRRTAVTHARRAAGMALNGVLVAMARRGWSTQQCETAWGRSYIDHLRALARSEPGAARGPMTDAVADACGQLMKIPVMPPTGLVSLKLRKDDAAHDALALAGTVLRGCAAVLDD